MPFYNSLAEARQENSDKFNVVAAFINNDADLVKSYADEKQLLVHTIAGVDLDELGIHMTPTIVMVDGTGKVLDSWRGALQSDGEREVFDAIGVAYKRAAGSTSTASKVTKTADVFDEQQATVSIRPPGKLQNDPAHFVEVFDVNNRGDIYLVYDRYMYRYEANGSQKEAHALPADFRSPFCVDDDGNIYAAGSGGFVRLFT